LFAGLTEPAVVLRRKVRYCFHIIGCSVGHLLEELSSSLLADWIFHKISLHQDGEIVIGVNLIE
jgi:hypothetical protein